MTKNKTIAIFGATGKVGSEFVNMALQDGYSLRVLIRRKKSFKAIDDNRIEVFEGDVTNPEHVENVIVGADIVVSVLGNTHRNVLIMENATENIFRAATAQSNPPRCLMISSVGVGGSSWLIKAMLTLIGGAATFADYESAEARVRNEKQVPFLVIRPYALTDKPATGKYKIIPGDTAHFAKPIARADVAQFFLESVADSSRDGTSVNIGAA